MSFESCFVRVNETFANLQASHKILGWSNKFGDIGHRKEGEVQVQDIQTSGMRKAGWLMSKHPWVKERCESKRICLPITLAFPRCFSCCSVKRHNNVIDFGRKKPLTPKQVQTSDATQKSSEQHPHLTIWDPMRCISYYIELHWRHCNEEDTKQISQHASANGVLRWQLNFHRVITTARRLNYFLLISISLTNLNGCLKKGPHGQEAISNPTSKLLHS